MNTYTYDEIQPGMEEHFTAAIGSEEMELFRRITGDENPLHTEQGVVYGMLTAGYLSTLAGMYLPGERSLIQQVKLDFLNRLELPKCPSGGGRRSPEKDSSRNITVSGVVSSKDDNFHTISLKFSVTDDTGVKILRGTMRVGMRE